MEYLDDSVSDTMSESVDETPYELAAAEQVVGQPRLDDAQNNQQWDGEPSVAFDNVPQVVSRMIHVVRLKGLQDGEDGKEQNKQNSRENP